MASTPVSITISPGATTTASSMAPALAALSSIQLNGLAAALIASLSGPQLATLAQAIIANLPQQSVAGVPATGQGFVSTSGFIEVSQ